MSAFPGESSSMYAFRSGSNRIVPQLRYSMAFRGSLQPEHFGGEPFVSELSERSSLLECFAFIVCPSVLSAKLFNVLNKCRDHKSYMATPPDEQGVKLRISLRTLSKMRPGATKRCHRESAAPEGAAECSPLRSRGAHSAAEG